MPLLLDAAFLPILGDYVVEHWLFQSFFELIVAMEPEPLIVGFWLLILVHEGDLFKAVNDAFEVLFAEGGELGQRVTPEELFVFYGDLVVLVCIVKGAVVCVHGGDMLQVPLGPADLIYGLVLQVNFHHGDRGRQVFWLLLGGERRARVLGLFVRGSRLLGG